MKNYTEIYAYNYVEDSTGPALIVWLAEGDKVAIFRGTEIDTLLSTVQPLSLLDNEPLTQKETIDLIKRNNLLAFYMPNSYLDLFKQVEQEKSEYDPATDMDFQLMAADALCEIGDPDGAWSMLSDMGMYAGAEYIEEEYFDKQTANIFPINRAS